MKNIQAECCFCHKHFNTTPQHYNWAIKQKWKFFCSKECRIQFKTKSTKINCATCNKEIIVKANRLRQSGSGKCFCSHACSAKYSNSHRILSEKSKVKTSQSLIEYYSKKPHSQKYISHNKVYIRIPKARPKISCVICGKIFKQSSDEKCCSRRCGQIYQYGSLAYTKEEVINRIYEISKKLNRTPQRRECEHKLWHSANKFFGSWNKLMVLCGLEPNHSKYQIIRLKCQDGHMADSISEKIVDEWLFQNKINHTRSKIYPGDNGNFNCDFYLSGYDIWIEYFGLIGQVEEYDRGVELKRKIARDNNLNFIEIIPSDLYPKNKLDSFLPRIKRGQEVVKQEGLFD